MTIEEKSTEDGKNYAQNVLNANPIRKHTLGGVFTCFTAGGRGKNLNVINDESVIISDTNKYKCFCTEMVITTLTENSTLAEAQTAFLDWYNALEFYPIPTAEVVTDLQ